MADAPISFCLVTTFYPPHGFGGDAVHAFRLANGLAARGHRVRVVHNPSAYRMLADCEAPMRGLADHPGIELRALPAGRAAAVGAYMTGRPAGYRRQLGRLIGDDVDVIQYSNPSLVGGPGGFGIGSALKLYTAHEHWLVCPTHVLFRYKREVCTKRTCWRCSAVHRRPPQLWRSTGLMGAALREIDVLLCMSRFDAELHGREFGHPQIRIVPPLAPPAAQLASAAKPPARERPYFLLAARLEPIKGALDLIDAFAGVRGADLLIVGDGSELERVRRQAAGRESVHVLGRRPNQEVISLCRGARAVVVPSLGLEVFPLTLTEAMAFGTPVVVRELGPLPEAIEDGGGLAFADQAGLRSTLQRLVDEPETARDLGREAKAIFERRYADHNFFQRYFDAIASAAARSGRDALGGAAARAAGAELATGVPG